MPGTPTTTDTTNDIIKNQLTKTLDQNEKWTGEYEGLEDLDISDDKKDAVRSEMRRRHTEQTYTRNNQELIESRAEVLALKKLLPQGPVISEEKQEELDKLKYADPDAWLLEMDSLRSSAQVESDSRTSEALSTARTEAGRTHEITRRATVLEEFNSRNPENPLTDDQLQFDIPPRLLKQVEDRKLSFDELLVKAHDYINSGKVISNPDYVEEPTFNGAPGTNNPQTPDEAALSSYENMKF